MTRPDTIVALSTPPGRGAIGVVRLSGPEAIGFVSRSFRTPSGQRREAWQPRRAYRGQIVAVDGAPIDEVLVTVYPAPHSYTGEEVVEVSAHGSMVALRLIIENFLSAGARLAEPGEFTKRAFLNGKLDLSEAEAVVDVINAASDRALQTALSQLSGRLGKAVAEIQEDLVCLLAQLEASLDFAEDEVPELDPAETLAAIENVRAKIDRLLSTWEQGRVLREGLRVAIVGRPNVGKSSLLNALLQEERALVTDIPGTTRDTVEEVVSIEGVPVRAIDTAGLRTSGDLLERLGVDRTRQALESADVVVFVLDRSEPLQEEDHRIAKDLAARPGETVVCWNKADLSARANLTDPSLAPFSRVVVTSALKQVGIRELGAAVVDCLFWNSTLAAEGAPLLTRLRHKQSLDQAAAALQTAGEAIGRQVPADLVCIDLREGLQAAAQITGAEVSEEVIDRLFAEFCIGK